MQKTKNSIKVVLLGESGVGKTCLIKTYIDKKFEETMSTISYEYFKKEVKRGLTTYNIHMWDTAGQERFRSLSKIFIKDSQIVLFVYDITNRKSFENISFWVNYVEDLLGKDIVLGLVGNKIDLFDKVEDDTLIVNNEEGQKYADQIGALFRETSAKESPEEFESYINELIDLFLSRRNNTEKEWMILSLDSFVQTKKKKKLCSK